MFETLLEPYHEELPDELQKAFGGYMKNLSVEKLSSLVEVMHEFLLLHVARRENWEDEDYRDNTNDK